MKTIESQGFFCVVYLKNEKKTVFYKKTWNPSKLVQYLNSNNMEWLWIKIFIDKMDYFSDRKGTNYHSIFDKDNPVINFTFKPFVKH